MEIPGSLPLVGNPPLAYRFGVFFFAGGAISNPLDTMFQKVSGLSTTVETETIIEGGQKFYSHQLPKKVQHENLVLERGLVVGSPLVQEFNAAMSLFKSYPTNVLIALLDSSKTPIANWFFMKTFPVKWSVSDLDATANAVVIETIELSYQRVRELRI